MWAAVLLFIAIRGGRAYSVDCLIAGRPGTALRPGPEA
jgi:hypothetical protein